MARFAQSIKGVWFILKTLPVFIVRQTPYRNADLILTGLSPEGFLTIHARGVLKITSPFHAMVALGSWSDFTINETKKKAYLEKANLIKFAPLPDQEGLIASIVMQVILQIILLDENADMAASMYPRLVGVRNGMQSALSTYTTFLLQYLDVQGVPMIVDYCVQCQSKLKIVGLNPQLGGFICQNCQAKVSSHLLPAEALVLMRKLKTIPFGEPVNNSTLKLLLPLIHQHFNFHLDVQLEGFKTIETLIQ